MRTRLTPHILTAVSTVLAPLAVGAALTMPQPLAAQTRSAAARSCVTFRTTAKGDLALVNTCPQRISVALCYVNPPVKTFIVTDGGRLYDMPPCELEEQASITASPGYEELLFPAAKVTNGLVWIECRNPETYFAAMTGFDRVNQRMIGSCETLTEGGRPVAPAFYGNSFVTLGHTRPAAYSTAGQYRQRADRPVPSVGPAQPRLRGGLASVVANAYPPAAKQAGHQGRVRFELAVNPAGFPVSCRITQSSGFSDLDEGTCELLLRRAKFYPTGAGGNQAYRNSITWSLN